MEKVCRVATARTIVPMLKMALVTSRGERKTMLFNISILSFRKSHTFWLRVLVSSPSTVSSFWNFINSVEVFTRQKRLERMEIG